MPTFFERVRTALASEGYQVEGERELGTGGMGVVVKARHLGLDKLVGIKVIRPELYSTDAVARFQRESQTLAKFSHPSIVRVLTSGETRVDELPYYVMDYVTGRTLADWLADGPLSRQHALKLGRDLLDALAHAHAHGIVHRDVKPANLFWDGEKAVLVDFGIAKRVPTSPRSSDGSTATGWVRGTIDYMSHEQLKGAEATPASDQYSAALVIFEAFTGRHRLDALRSQKHTWRGVPWFTRAVLARALDDDPAKRWPDVATFRRKLRIWPPVWQQLVAAAIVVVTLAAVWPSHGLELRVSRLDDTCTGRVDKRMQDSLVAALQGNLDFPTTKSTLWSWIERGPTMRVRGSTCVRNDSISATLALSLPKAAAGVTILARGDTAQIGMLAETLAREIMREIWQRENPLDSFLPVGALPLSARGLADLIVAERLFAQARWGEADSAYRAAQNADSTCWVCDWRLAEVDKWLALPFDSARYTRVLRHLAAFPPAYQSVIRIARQPLRVMLDSLERIGSKRLHFLTAQFMYADELYHRGPLIGFSRNDAIEALQRVATARHDFLPAVEHLAWAMTAAGDEHGARQNLARLATDARALQDPYVLQVRMLLKVGFTCRFDPAAACEALLDSAMSAADLVKYPDLATGPRYLMTFDAPRAAISLGKRFAGANAPTLESGLVAELSGSLALGMVDSARAAAQRLRALGHPELTVLPAELDGALLLLDAAPGETATRWPDIYHDLARHAHSAASTPATRRRAAWMLLLLARRAGALQDSSFYARLIEGETGRRPLRTLLEADRFARQGRVADALRLTEPLTPLQADSLGDTASADPFFRSALHLLRAEWYARSLDRDAALKDLQWSDNNDALRLDGPPQVADIDWGFGTLARWRAAQLLEASGDARLCDLDRAIVRAWSAGDPRYRARADTARARAAALSCPPAP